MPTITEWIEAARPWCPDLQLDGNRFGEVEAELMKAGWSRNCDEEGFSKLWHRCYSKRGVTVQVTVANFLGAFTQLEAR